MWITKNRVSTSLPGNSPPKMRNALHTPTTGTEMTTEYAMRRPVPDSWSSGSEYPVKPLAIASRSRVTPIIQLSSRGRRNAPVKKMRMRWAMIAPTKISAAQWWICRITKPARTSKLMRSTDS